MKAFVRHTGIAAPLPVDNVDTDQIIPSREMKTVSREGLGEGLFAGWRYETPGGRDERAKFVLNRAPFRGATILVAGENFGCGSSREHAVWALVDYGVRAIVAKGFGEIFHGNCIRNGICPAVLPADAVDSLVSHLDGAERPEMTVDLETKAVSAAGWPEGPVTFDFEPLSRRMLLGGLDPVALTETQRPAIDAFLERDRRERPWLY